MSVMCFLSQLSTPNMAQKKDKNENVTKWAYFYAQHQTAGKKSVLLS